MKKYLFAKSFAHLSKEELMQFCSDLHLDGPTLLLREGYWTTYDNLKTIPDFIKCANDFGLEVKYADTSITDAGEKAQEIFSVLRENGVELVRLGYLVRPHGAAVRELADTFADFAEKMAHLAEKNDLKAVVQLHGWMYPQTATAAYPAIKSLDPRYIGVKIDPGNNFAQEGYEYFDYQADLLGEYIAALGAKNAVFQKENGKFRPAFAPSHQGIADYHVVYRELKRIDFGGPTILMPLYEAKDTAEYKTLIAEEIDYLNQCYYNEEE